MTTPHMARDVDVVVIGGGPAGATAARLLARWGHEVILLHRRAPSPPLAESLPPSCRAIMGRVGILDLVEGAGFVRSSGNTVLWGGERDQRRIESFGSDRWGHQVFRPDLDRLLRDAAAAAGVAVHVGSTATGVATAPNGLREVIAQRAEGAVAIRASWVVDATGRAGLLGRHRERRVDSGVRTTALVGLWDRPDGWPLRDHTHTVVESFADGWGWTIPVSETRRCVALMIDPRQANLQGGSALGEQLAAGLAQTRLLGPLLEGAHQAGDAFSCDATPYQTHDVVGDGTIIAGDAASFIDPLSSYGVKKALTSAWLAAVCVHSALTRPHVTAAAATLYREREAAYVATARRALAQVSGDTGQESAFWRARQALAAEESPAEEDQAASLRSDPAVHAAFAELKQRPTARLCWGPHFATADRAVVVDHTVELQPHLVLADVPEPLRFLRNVDLLALAEVATTHTDVGVIFGTYCERVSPVALPDFLGALSTLIARRVLRFA